MKKKLITTALLAMAGLAFTPGANAATAPTSTPGDLFLALRQVDNGTGATTSSFDYIADLGSYTDFEAGGAFYNPGVAVSLNTTNNTKYGTNMGANWVSDINSGSVFGSNWYTSNSTYYAVVGGYSTGSLANKKYWAIGTDNSVDPWTQATNAANGIAVSDIAGFAGAAYNGSTLAANGNEGVLSASNTNNGYSYYQHGNPSNTSGQNLNVFGLTIGNGQSDEGLVNTTLALYYIPASGNGSEVELGTFNISSSGNLTFTAVPEPSTYAMVGLAAVFFVVWKMKRNALLNFGGLAS